MSSDLDFPLTEAVLAYQTHSDPRARAERDQRDFLHDLEGTREMMAVVAKSAQQKELLTAEMLVYQRGYVARWRKVLTELEISGREDYWSPAGRMSSYGKEHTSFQAWQREAKKSMLGAIMVLGRPEGRWRDKLGGMTGDAPGIGV